MTFEEIEKNDLDFKQTIEEHLSQNDTSLRVSTNTSEGIVVSNIKFDVIPSISFDNTKSCNYKITDSKSQEIQSNTIKRIKFQNCEFNTEPIITNENVFLIEFDNCIFNSIDDISINLLGTTHDNKQVYFYDCKFDKFQLGDIRAIMFNSNIKLCRFFLYGGEIDEFIIENIEMASKFYINKQYDDNDRLCKINTLNISNSIFKENFKLHNCEVEEVIIKDVDFEKNADFYMSKFVSGAKNEDFDEATEINFHALNFKSLALFGDVHFYKKFHLRYVTLEGYSHFRNAIFDEGLDLDYTNIQNEMNFFGAEGLSSKLSKQNTSQETYRIIKHNFMKLNNVIEANKYHSLELNTHRKNIRFIDVLLDCKLPIQNSLDWVVSAFHLLSSNYSKNWLFTLVWIISISIITNLFLEYELLIQEKINWETLFRYINILTSIDDFKNAATNEKSYVAMTLNKVSLGYLYYQFLTAIRRNTKN